MGGIANHLVFWKDHGMEPFKKKKDQILDKGAVLEALREVRDPDLDQDIVSLGFVKNLRLDRGKVGFSIELNMPLFPSKMRLQSEAESQVRQIPGVTEVEVSLTANVSTRTGVESNPLISNIRNTIAVASGKGGVGKSTVAVNLAIALGKYGARVGLMDADVYGPSIPMLMGAFEPPRVGGGKILPSESRSVKLISMGYFLPKDEAVIWRGPMLHKMVQQFIGDVDWGELDYLVIDLPPGTGDIQLSLCQTIPLTGAVIVSTPQDLALEVASKAIAMFKRLNTPILGIAENMSYYVCSHCGERDDIFGHGGARQASKKAGFPFLGEIPLSTLIRTRSDDGQPVALDDGDSPISRTFTDLARAVASQVSLVNAQGVPSITIEE
jgi:ATP-binding protein involved in chromosome partitioning